MNKIVNQSQNRTLGEHDTGAGLVKRRRWQSSRALKRPCNDREKAREQYASAHDHRPFCNTSVTYEAETENLMQILPADLEMTSCLPSEDERHFQDKIEWAVTRFQSAVIETCLDAANHGVTITSYTRDRLTNNAVMIYQFANKVLLPKTEPGKAPDAAESQLNLEDGPTTTNGRSTP